MTSTNPPPAPGRAVLWGVALICFANLLLEVVLTRIFSATMYYHFTFLAIALALFGVGASGVYVYVNQDRFPPERVREDLARAARRFAGATVLALIFVLAHPMEIVTGGGEPQFTNQTFLQLVLLNGFAALPFFFAGVVVSLAVAHYRQHIDRVYFFDLCGAAAAALFAGPLLGIFGGPSLVIVVALCAAGGATLVTPSAGRRRALAYGPVAAIGALLVLNLVHPIITVPSVKGVKAGRLVFEKWNTFSRITLEKLGNESLDVKIDASASTAVTSLAAGAGWKGEISALAYSMFDGGAGSALVIGPGGGRDVSHALNSGAHHVTGVEVNPIIGRTIMQEQFAGSSGSLYSDPRVTLVVDEGRSFVRRSDDKYDVIQASLVDTWAATAAGAFALTENTLYTLEAFSDYYDHLTDRGAITMSRWHSGADPETTRLLLLAAGALERRGVAPADARKHLFFAVSGALGTMVAKRTPFTAEELARLEAACAASKFKILLSPHTDGTSQMEQLVDSGSWSALVRGQTKDLTPPTDDRPFFFYFLKPADLWNLGQHFGGKTVGLGNPAVWMLIALGFGLVALTLAFIILPLALHRREALLGGGRGGPLRRSVALGYFALLGLAFITVEIALLQKFTFFLGHPSYSLLVVLFAILLGTAFGARASGRIPAARRAVAALVCGLLLAVLVGVYAAALGGILSAWVAWPLAARIAVAGILVAASGVLMGIMLPTGIKLLGERDAEIVPWSWGVNGATSVIGTVAATIVAIASGFTFTLCCGAALYALAGLGAFALGRLAAKAEAAAQAK